MSGHFWSGCSFTAPRKKTVHVVVVVLVVDNATEATEVVPFVHDNGFAFSTRSLPPVYIVSKPVSGLLGSHPSAQETMQVSSVETFVQLWEMLGSPAGMLYLPRQKLNHYKAQYVLCMQIQLMSMFV